MLNTEPFACPKDLLEQAAKRPPVKAVIVGAGSRTALQSAKLAWEAGLVLPILIGLPKDIRDTAKEIGWNIDAYALYPAESEREAAELGVALARSGEADTVMKGQVHTDSLMRAVVNREKGLRTGHRISHVFHMTIPERPGFLLITDAAINVAPDVALRLDILRNAVGLLHAMGIKQPKAAVLSATESHLPGMPSSGEAAEIVTLVREGAVEDAIVAGPLALDGAISPEAARMKSISGPIAGDADILLVPSIEAGNMLFKSMVYFAGATAAGLVLGAKVPIILTSRADPPEARLAACALAAIAAAGAP